MQDLTSIIGRECEVVFSSAGISSGYTGRVDAVDDATISVTPVAVTDGEVEFVNGQPAHVAKTYPNGGRVAIADIQRINVL